MKIHIFCRKNAQNEIIESPFLEYLEKEYCHNGELKKDCIKKIAQIDATIQHIADAGGRYNIPPISKHYQGRTLGIIKLSEDKRLIRIAFWAEVNEKMVILNIKDKPKLYEKRGKNKIDKDIQNWLDETEEMLETYKKNPKSYINYHTLLK